MIKVSKELKAGMAALIILLLFYWGFSYLKGKNILNGSSSSFYTTYNHVNGLKKSSPVMFHGYAIGSVVGISYDADAKNPNKQMLVEFTVEENIDFSKNSKVKVSSGLMGGSSLVIVPEKEGEMAKPGDFLEGIAVPKLTDRLDPLQNKVESAIHHIDELMVNVNTLLNDATIKNIQSSLHHVNAVVETLNHTSQKIDVMVASNQKNITTSIDNLKYTSENVKVLSDSLAQVKLLSISKKINSTMSNLESITAGIEKGEGTLGKLTKDEKLYNNLEAASKELEELLENMKEHPKRYVHFSLFGKKETPYQESK